MLFETNLVMLSALLLFDGKTVFTTGIDAILNYELRCT